eukprot:1148464-Pelagomonas_calceolata.AAC.1
MNSLSEGSCKPGLNKEKALELATKLHYHAVKTLTKITNTKHAIGFSKKRKEKKNYAGSEDTPRIN